MKEPLRWRDSQAPASSELRALLAAAEPPAPVPAAVRERVRRALAGRAAATERSAVCGSHALGCALALATCLTWLASQRTPEVEPAIARAPSAQVVPHAAPTPTPYVEASPPAPERAADSVAARAPERRAVARRAGQGRGRHSAAGPARSRKRIAALVDGILKPDAQLLDRARREVERDPEQALAMIEAFRSRHPGSPLPAPTVVAEVDALRRLGRFDEALAKARALLEGSRKPYYADVMADRFALLEL